MTSPLYKPRAPTRTTMNTHIVHHTQHPTSWWTFLRKVNRTFSKGHMLEIIHQQSSVVDVRSSHRVRGLGFLFKTICSRDLPRLNFQHLFFLHKNILPHSSTRSYGVLNCSSEQIRVPCPPQSSEQIDLPQIGLYRAWSKSDSPNFTAPQSHTDSRVDHKSGLEQTQQYPLRIALQSPETSATERYAPCPNNS